MKDFIILQLVYDMHKRMVDICKLTTKIRGINMKTDKPKEYVAPEVKVVEVIVEKGFAITGYIINERLRQEKHIVDEPAEW